MCLLIVVSRAHGASPLIVAANRDELFARPAVAMTVLRQARPRILGGRDELAGGTWLAVNDAGVVAGLTNRPATAGRDPAKRSRGELPLALAQHGDAPSAVEDFEGRFRPTDYNPAWLLVADRSSAYSIDMTEGDVPVAEELGPGTHILENRPLRPESAKARHVRELLGDLTAVAGYALVPYLHTVLSDHSRPKDVDSDDEMASRYQDSRAACVHTEKYGTRSSAVVVVPPDRRRCPYVDYSDGPSCVNPLVSANSMWRWVPG